MKKIFMIMLFAFLLPFSVKAAETDNKAASASDFEYTITDKKVTIDKYIGEDSTVVIPDKLNSCPVSKIGSGAFENCDFITQVKCSDDITEIGSSAFTGCSELENLILPKNLKTLGYYFISGTAIKKLTIPSALTNCYAYNIRYSGYDYDGPLAGAESLTDIIIESGMENIPEYLACISSEKESHINKIEIPDTVKTIKGSAFLGCKELLAITLPDSVVTVGNQAFYNNESLKEVQFSSNLETIGSNAFGNCKSLETINIPKTVTSLKGHAFTECTGLEKVIFNDNSKNGVALTIGDNVFLGCTSLAEIAFSKNIVQLGSSCFGNCTGLTSLELPDNITEIGSSAFAGCSELESLILPKKLKTLGYYFISGTAIKELTIPATLTKCYGYNTKYSGYDYSGPLAGAKSLKKLCLASGIEAVPEYLASASESNGSHIEDVDIPSTAKSIGNAAFWGCVNMKYIFIPASVTSIADNAFYNCKLNSILGVEGSKAESYAEEHNIPFNEVEGDYNNSGILKSVDKENSTITVNKKEFKVSDSDILSKAAKILEEYSDKNVLCKVHDQTVTYIEALKDLVYVSASISTQGTKCFIYEDGKYSDSINATLSVKCKVRDNAYFSAKTIMRHFPYYQATINKHNFKTSPDNIVMMMITGKTKTLAGEDSGVKLGLEESKQVGLNIKPLSSYIPDKVSTKVSVGVSTEYNDGETTPYNYCDLQINNKDYARQKEEQRKKETEYSKKEQAAQKTLLTNNNIITLDPTLSDYFGKLQEEQVQKFLSVYMALAIKSEDMSYCKGEGKAEKAVREAVFKRLGINKKGLPFAKHLESSFSIVATTKKGERTIDFNYKILASSLGGSGAYAGFGTINYAIKEDHKEGTLMIASVDMEKFAQQVQDLAEAAVKNAYNATWGNNANEVAELLIDHTILTVINQQCGSFSDGVFRLLTKPAETHAKKLRKETRVGIHCPVDVYVYDSSHNLCGEIINNKVNTSYDDLFMYVENDAKYVTFYDDNYYIKLVGNDNGEMNYEIEEIEDDSITRKISFENVPLGNGKTYTGYIPDMHNMSNKLYALTDKSGEMTVANVDTLQKNERVFVENVSLNKTNIKLSVNDKETLTAIVKPDNALIKNVFWSSSNKDVALVNNDGEIKGIAPGETVITAATWDGNFTAECTVTVVATSSGIKSDSIQSSHVQVSKIEISGISKKIAAGKKLILKVNVLPKNASNQKLIWRSSNPKIATVTKTGAVTLKKKTGGKKVIITVTATDGGGASASWQITSMRGIVKKIKITGAKQVKAGKKMKLKAKVNATKKANTKILWTSSNPKAATVNAKGIVKAKKSAKGKTVKITAMATDGSNKKATIKVKIK